MPDASNSQRQAAFDIARLGRELCNWNRWGENDQLGTVNYITPAKVAEACGLVRTGEIFESGLPLGKNGPQTGTNPTRFNPLHFMTELPEENVRPGGASFGDDVLLLPLQTATQWDALAHCAHNGIGYGGRSAKLIKSSGAEVNAIQAVSGRILTRGVLLDMARHKGVDSLEPASPITTADLEACLEREGVQAGEGDVILVRTGFMSRCRKQQWLGYGVDAPGLNVLTLPWIHDHRLAGVAADTTAIEVKPADVPGVSLPFHAVALPYMGLLLGEMFDMEKLAESCLRDGRYDFMLVAPPLPVIGGLGSPINPYAVK